MRLDVDGFETVQGDFRRIEPGELLVAVLEVPITDGRLAGRVASRGLEIGLEVEATPVDAQGATLQEVSAQAGLWLDTPEDESLPGFADSVSDGAASFAPSWAWSWSWLACSYRSCPSQP